MSDEYTGGGETDGDDLSRRGFLAASSAAVALSVAQTGDQSVETAPLSDVVLRRSDLVETTVGYADRGGAPADASLIQHLRTTVPGFSEESVALSAFVTGTAAAVPTHVESAAIARGGTWNSEHLAGALDGWLRGEERGAASVTAEDGGPRRVIWETIAPDGTVDVVSLFVTAAGPVLLTIAHGDADAGLGPHEAVERYEATMRDRVIA